MRTLTFVPLVLVILLLSGCATIMAGSTVDVTLATSPPGAKAFVNGQTYETVQPVTLPIRRGKEPTIHIEKDGYEPQDVKLLRKFGGWVWGNLAFLGYGLIGLGVDLVSERAYGVDPDTLHVTLVPKTVPVAQPVAGSPSNLVKVSDVDSPRKTTHIRNKAHAVVVGVETYRDPLPRAEFAERDAAVVADYVSQTLGYPPENVALLINHRASKSDLEKYFETWLANRVEKDDVIFIYYSGHGTFNAKTGDAFLLPYDGDLTFIENTGYSLRRLYAHLADLPAKEVVVILDSCFSGAGGRSLMAKSMRPIVTEVTNPVIATGKTIVIAASGSTQISSSYDDKAHGLMTYFLLKGLGGEADMNHDGKIEVPELFEYLKPQVERVARRQYNTEQTPQLLGDLESLKGSLVLFE